jgi:Cytochrome C biogenesis protein transmembrane region
MGGIGQLVMSGPLIVAVPVAAAAGAITFASPCCLPLVPGYLAYVTGMSEASADPAHPEQDAAPAPRPASRGRAVAGTALFVLGFSALLASYGAAPGCGCTGSAATNRRYDRAATPAPRRGRRLLRAAHAACRPERAGQQHQDRSVAHVAGRPGIDAGEVLEHHPARDGHEDGQRQEHPGPGAEKHGEPGGQAYPGGGEAEQVRMADRHPGQHRGVHDRSGPVASAWLTVSMESRPFIVSWGMAVKKAAPIHSPSHSTRLHWLMTPASAAAVASSRGSRRGNKTTPAIAYSRAAPGSRRGSRTSR